MTSNTEPPRARRSRAKPSNAAGRRNAARKSASEFTARQLGRLVLANQKIEKGQIHVS